MSVVVRCCGSPDHAWGLLFLKIEADDGKGTARTKARWEGKRHSLLHVIECYTSDCSMARAWCDEVGILHAPSTAGQRLNLAMEVWTSLHIAPSAASTCVMHREIPRPASTTKIHRRGGLVMCILAPKSASMRADKKTLGGPGFRTGGGAGDRVPEQHQAKADSRRRVWSGDRRWSSSLALQPTTLVFLDFSLLREFQSCC